MRQPIALRTELYVPWSKGRGDQVWAMICAVVEGNLDKVRSLVQKNQQLLTCEYEYFTPMHFAVRENHRHIVAFLLEQGVNIVHSPGEPLLITAGDRNYSEMVSYLKEVAKTKYRILPEGNIIAEAIKSGNTGYAKELTGNRALIDVADTNGNQPIHWAVFMANFALIDYLLLNGADINASRPDGARPIDLANIYLHERTWHVAKNTDLFAKNSELITFLIERGACCDMGTAARIGNYDLVKEMLEKDTRLVNQLPPYSDYFSGLPLRMAAGAGYRRIVELLLGHHAHPNTPEPGVAPEGGSLHAAVWGGNFDIARLLLEHGANVDAEVESSGDSIVIAEWVKAPRDFIAVLQQHSGKSATKIPSADYNKLKEMMASNIALGEPFIDYFIREDLLDHLAVLLESDADILRHRDYDPAAWWDSFTFKSAESARWLLERGLPANRYNWLGITPLHRAAGSGDLVMVELLLSFGADINAVETEWCSTPLGWAVKNGQLNMVEWLLKRGADINAEGQKTWSTPISWALRKGFHEIVKRLRN